METQDQSEQVISPILTTCYMCKNMYEKPKVIACFHTYCLSCLQKKNPEKSFTVHCVICGHQSVLPVGGLNDLPNNSFVSRIMQSTSIDVKNSIHTDRTDSTTLPSNMAMRENGSSVDSIESDSENYPNEAITCPYPCNKPLSMYCKSCEAFVCIACAETKHSQHGDCLCDLHTLTAESEEALLKQADDLEQRLMPLQSTLRDITHVLADLDESKELSKQQVNDSFDLLERTLRHRRNELLRNIDTIYKQKQSELVKQADVAERRVRNLEEGLDVILLSLCPLQSDSNESAKCNGDSNHTAPAPDVRLFFIHKQVSKTLNEVCKDELDSDLNYVTADSDASSDSNTYRTKSVSEGSVNPLKVIAPCENSHIFLNNTHDLTKIDRMISNLGLVETSHAVAQKCAISGQVLTTGFCKAGEENTIVLTAKTWTGELETTGKVQVSVNMEYIGPPDKSDIVTYRSLRSKQSRSVRNTWDGSRLPVPSFHSKLSQTNTPKRPLRSISRETDSPTPLEQRGPLRDLLIPRSPESSKTGAGHPAYTSDDALLSPSATTRVDYIKNGDYKITFTPAARGKYRISVDLYGKAMHNKSFVITAIDDTSRPESRQSHRPIAERESSIPSRSSSNRPKVTKDVSNRPNVSPKIPATDDLIIKLGTKGRLNGEFSNPQGVSIDRLGRLLVSDSTNQSMQVFSVDSKHKKDYRFLFKFAEKGRGINQVQRPTGVYGLPNGHIAVSDYDNKVVKIYGEDGKHKQNIGSGKLMGPKGVCLDRNGHLVVVDNKLCQIMIFQMNGRLLKKFGSHGREPHQLAGPQFVAVNKENSIYVSDFYNHSVKIFSSYGDFLEVIGSSGKGFGQFNGPTGLAIDSRENLIVADWGNSRLQVFNKDGSFLSFVNTNEDPLYGPQGVTSIHDDLVAVADAGNQCIKIYRYLQ